MLVTDIVLSIPADPPPIVQLDPYPLLFHARDDAFHIVFDTEANRRKGWQRIVLFAFYFQPSALEVISTRQVLRHALGAPDRSQKAYFGLFPFKWNDWQQSFDALRGTDAYLLHPSCKL